VSNRQTKQVADQKGYWVPFEAAKAIAATFCYEFRHALIPVFGLEFVDICIKPMSPGFGDMSIDPKITQRCIEQADHYRLLEQQGPTVPSTPVLRQSRALRSARSSSRKLKPRFKPVHSDVSSTDGSTAETEDEDEDRAWSAATTPKALSIPFSPAGIPRSTPRSDELGMSPKSGCPWSPSKRTAAQAFRKREEYSTRSLATSRHVRPLSYGGEEVPDGNDDGAEVDTDNDDDNNPRRKRASLGLREFDALDAAHALIRLSRGRGC
jgi:hypothetical protein